MKRYIILINKFFALTFEREAKNFYFGLLGIAYSYQKNLLFTIEIIFLFWSLQFHFGKIKEIEL